MIEEDLQKVIYNCTYNMQFWQIVKQFSLEFITCKNGKIVEDCLSYYKMIMQRIGPTALLQLESHIHEMKLLSNLVLAAVPRDSRFVFRGHKITQKLGHTLYQGLQIGLQK